MLDKRTDAPHGHPGGPVGNEGLEGFNPEIPPLGDASESLPF
jgi:hypothetical protein